MDATVAREIGSIRASHAGYDRKAALAQVPLCHYAAYYKQYKKTYHVLGQLESILLKDRSIPPVGAPVEAMFLAEIKNLLLTAGHDLGTTKGQLTVDVADAPTPYESISGKEQQLTLHDLYLHDDEGVLSSIIGGPDGRTKITGNTQKALYFVYGVEGITEDAVRAHLDTIAGYLTQAIPGVEIETTEVF